MSLKIKTWLFLATILVLLVMQIIFTRLNQQSLIDSISAFQVAIKDQQLVSELERDVLDLQRHVLVFKDTGSQSAVRRFDVLVDEINASLSTLIDNLPVELTSEETLATINAMQQHLQDYDENFESVIEARQAQSLYFEQGIISSINDLLVYTENIPPTKSLINDVERVSDIYEEHNLFRYHLSLAENKAFQYLLEPNSLLKNEFISNIDSANSLVNRDYLLPSYTAEVDRVLTNIKSQFQLLASNTQGYLFLVNVVMAGSANEFLYLASELSALTNEFSRLENVKIANTIQQAQFSLNIYIVTGILISLLIGLFVERRIIHPIIFITDVFEKIVKDKEVTEIPGTSRNDEIGKLATAAKVFNAKTVQTKELLVEAQTLNEQQSALNKELVDAKAQAEHANASKSIFLANMSHEIRTPINAIVGLVDITFDHPLSDATRANLSKINYSSQILLNVINDILDFSKIEAGKLEIEDSYFSFASLFDSLLAVAGLKASEKNLNLTLYVEPTLPTNAIGDPLRISQIILNVVNNAIKFTQTGGVDIRFTHHLDDHQFFLIIEVADTGLGMSEDQLKKVFTPFDQADGSTSRKFGGTGLGLSIVNQLCKLMEGDVKASSIPGKGSKFVCKVKLKQEENPQPLMIRSESFDRQLIYVRNEAESLVQHNYLRLIANEVCYRELQDLPNIIQSASSSQIFIFDVDNARQSRQMHDHILELKERGHLLACVTNTQPEQLKKVLSSQWNCPVISHPFTPIEFYSFANTLYGNEDFFAAKSQDEDNAEHQIANINVKTYSGHVLLVEDNSINQMVAGEMLHSFGLSFDVAEDGQQAVTKLLNSPYYDLVLMDIQMPILDGNAATRKIREMGYLDVPIIGLSANAMREDHLQASQSGMNSYLTKPIRRETLRKTIAEYLPEKSTEST